MNSVQIGSNPRHLPSILVLYLKRYTLVGVTQ